MDVLKSAIRCDTPAFQANAEFHQALSVQLRREMDNAKNGGGASALKRHRERGKKTARERIQDIMDPGSPFLELSTLAAHGQYDGEVPSAGIVTGIGLVHKQPCMFVSNDAHRHAEYPGISTHQGGSVSAFEFMEP